MPMTKKSGKVRTEELPATLQRSPKKAQETFAKAHDHAVEEYGEGQRAHRVAYAALKRKFAKVGDHWVKKDGKGPSDPRAKNPPARENRGKTSGGVGVEGSSKDELMHRAASLGIRGRSKMSKDELAAAIARTQD